ARWAIRWGGGESGQEALSRSAQKPRGAHSACEAAPHRRRKLCFLRGQTTGYLRSRRHFSAYDPIPHFARVLTSHCSDRTKGRDTGVVQLAQRNAPSFCLCSSRANVAQHLRLWDRDYRTSRTLRTLRHALLCWLLIHARNRLDPPRSSHRPALNGDSLAGCPTYKRASLDRGQSYVPSRSLECRAR